MPVYKGREYGPLLVFLGFLGCSILTFLIMSNLDKLVVKVVVFGFLLGIFGFLFWPRKVEQ
jgi:hypothetical protein